MSDLAQLSALPADTDVVRIVLAGALGMFLGFEREWSHKAAGVRTFALISLLAAVFTVTESELLLVVGGLLVIVQGVLLAVQGLLAEEDEHEGLALTTSVSMLVAYGVGALVAGGFVLEGVTVAVLSSMLLVLKRELHRFAWGLSRSELRSASEFAILAFVVYPLLPAEPLETTVAGLPLEVELRVVWLMVVTVAGIGIVNYGVVQTYGGRGIAVTGFFGGLASSTAVVGTMLDHVDQRPEATSYAVAAILLADAAMAVRNLAIAVAFTFRRGVLVEAVAPLGAVVLGSLAVAAYTADWRQSVDMDLDSPFSMRNALVFGAVFLVVLVAGAAAQGLFGNAGLYVTSALAGLVSSAGATTSAVLLYRGGGISAGTATLAVLVATASSIVVKAGLTAASSNREFTYRVAVWSGALLVGATLVTLAAAL
ncbi:MgtC/SapB family protein [Halomicrobium salinisoli]|uniref:MgtC/SapB family protein n=1 Tax=Halomicrobium salinisoli TaxID=2878391 RepID=UPI001CF0642F|nr:MgtC/SapB family protein [Halomicrobium salinisoli]